MDGAHIRTLLLTFLFRYCRPLFEQGHVFVGMPPLFKVLAVPPLAIVIHFMQVLRR